MFTLQQIKAAHAKVESGADFPRYIQEIKALGLIKYTFSVVDGSVSYSGESGQYLVASGIYDPKTIQLIPRPDELRKDIVTHQQGKSDFMTFCCQAAAAGVRQWVIDTQRMLCIYEDIHGREIVTETIPEVGY